MTLKLTKKYGILWYNHKCICGKTHSIPLIFLNIIFSFKEKYYFRCSNCNYVSCLRNIQNIIIDSTDEKMKEKNRYEKV